MNAPKRKTTSKLTASKRLKRGRGRRRFITRAEARRQAARHVVKRMFKGAEVRDGAQAKIRVYLRDDWKAEDMWVVFKTQEEPGTLKATEVVLVCKRSGRVLYEGSANDEG